MSITILNKKAPYRITRFPAGELGVTVEPFAGKSYIIARIQNSDDFMTLALLIDASKRMICNDTKSTSSQQIGICLPYIPYARQDRVANEGEPLSIKVFANLLAATGVTKVKVYDPHSDVAVACLDQVLPHGVLVVSAIEIIAAFPELINYISTTNAVLVSPDAGANKKVFKIAQKLGHPSYIRADKVRNTQTGEITGTTVYADSLEGQNMLIIDDICDGGGTFTALAKELKAKGAKSVALYVTHGIFTKGTDVLYRNGIDHIFTTNSYYDVLPAGISEKVVIKDLFE
jgi:ribose-phosphate pyrophosphokinase